MLCPNCGAEVPTGIRFCGSCGTKIDGPAAPANTMFFGATQQAPGRAKLTVIKGEGIDGVTYLLNANEHLAGRLEGAIMFPDDPLLSPRHAASSIATASCTSSTRARSTGSSSASRRRWPWSRSAVPDRRAAAADRAVAARSRPPAGRRGDLLLRQPQAALEDEADPAPSGRRDRHDLPFAERHHLDRPRRERRQLPRRSLHLGPARPDHDERRRSDDAHRPRLEERHVRPHQRRADARPRGPRVPGAAALRVEIS